MARLRRTLLIGLGGTGVKAILDAKKMFYENWDKLAYERSGCLWKLFANWWFYGTGNRNASK